MTRTLILMRHGKSAYPPGTEDHERPLAPRGRREAALAGDWLRTTVPAVDAVRCSTATRTRETLAATGIAAPVEFDAGIYGAEPDDLIELIQMTDPAAATLLVIGHAPGMPQTAWDLAAEHDTEDALRISRKFPTSALAVLRFAQAWDEVLPGTGDLVTFHVPR
ncbi:histidine phosphatase family protein [Nocardia sp. NPDC019395]|uniref:SixA phosphatase family protein n=1 Tax=Nocardia sp. NPDC019395 TaxID=3154686 RepID=UPI0033DF6885